MVFSSLLFVFLFLALNLVSQAALRGARQKNIAMLLFSLVFFSWAGPRYVVLLLLDTALCWFFAICIEREPQRKKLHLSLCVALVLLVLGAVLIALGANLLVDNGTLIAQALGVPESVIALTFVALGTSLPELVTAITSLVKGCSDLSLGNIVGANVFNLVLVSGMSVTLAPFTVPQSSTLFGINSSLVLEIPVMLAVMMIMTLPALKRGRLSRAQGIILLCIYAAFCAIQFTM